MPTNVKMIILLALTGMIPLLAGCLGSGGHNPVADTSLSDQVNASLAAETLTTGQVLGARARPQALGKSRYSYAEPPFTVVHKIKSANRGPGSLKIRVLSATNADHIFITLDSMKVKPRESIKGKGKGGSQFKNIPMNSTDLDLCQPTALTEILAGADLPTGIYDYMEFSIKNAKVVVNGVTFPVKIPSSRVRFFGSFEVKDNFTTELSIRFFNKLSLKVKQNGKKKETEYLLNPIVKISSTLVQKEVVALDGDVSGTVLDYVKKTPISGVAVCIEGTSFSGVTDANGAFSFTKVPNGTYNVKLSHADYLDKSSVVIVKGGEIAEISCEMNPAVVRSSVGNTGWFSETFPFADANGAYGEMALETPVMIDFVSLAFVKAEVVFDAEYALGGGARMNAYISSSQQVQVITNLGGWWVGNNALLGYALGEFGATSPASHYNLNVTDYIRNNPSAAYFFAARNRDAVDIRMQNVQLSIFYR